MHFEKTPCQYVIVRFAPFVETEEFANIGVVAFAPKKGYFGFKIEHNKYKRVTDFFTGIKGPDYKSFAKNYMQELQRIQKMIAADPYDTKTNLAVFKDVIRNREGIIQFSKLRLTMTDDPAKQVEELFDYYVERNFITQEYHEAKLEKKVKLWIKEGNIVEKFTKDKIGDDLYHATFPFVASRDNKPVKIIKPFFLGQSEPSKIIDHGLVWQGKLTRLKTFLPRKILFTVEGPVDGTRKQRMAYNEVMKNLRDTNLVTVEEHFDRDAIIAFAASA